VAFPPNPSPGDTCNVYGRIYKWSGLNWEATKVPTSHQAPVYVSASAPAQAAQGDLWYNSVSGDFSVYIAGLNGGAWVGVVPFPENSIDQNGGTFTGPVYASYPVPNNPVAFTTVSSVATQISQYLQTNNYTVAGNGVNIGPNGQVVSLDCGTLV
jgi:hypothetical protein